MVNRNIMSRVNINDFLINYIGIDEDELPLMPDYVKVEIVEDNYDAFEEFITEDGYGTDRVRNF